MRVPKQMRWSYVVVHLYSCSKNLHDWQVSLNYIFQSPLPTILSKFTNEGLLRKKKLCRKDIFLDPESCKKLTVLLNATLRDLKLKLGILLQKRYFFGNMDQNNWLVGRTKSRISSFWYSQLMIILSLSLNTD